MTEIRFNEIDHSYIYRLIKSQSDQNWFSRLKWSNKYAEQTNFQSSECLAEWTAMVHLELNSKTLFMFKVRELSKGHPWKKINDRRQRENEVD